MHQIIAGRRLQGGSGEVFDVTDPATGEVLEQVVLADAGDVDAAVAAARAAFPAWSGAPPRSSGRPRSPGWPPCSPTGPTSWRSTESRQTGKPIRLATGFDVPGTIDNVAFFAGAARNLEGKSAGEYSGDHTSYVRREPIGVVGSVAPWNYPLQMAAWKVLPAIAAGNTIVLKPAELTPLTSLMLAEAAAEAGIPDGVVNVVTGTGRVAGEALMGHPDVDMVSFTGSSAVGRRVMELAACSANGPKRVHLELGGKAPFLVFDDADLDAAVQGAVAGALINTGQDCTAATRAYVQRPLYDAFVAGVADLMGTVVLGDPLDADRPGPAGVRRAAGAGGRLRRPRPPRRGQGRERRRGARWGARPRGVLRAHPGRRRRPASRDRPGRGVRPGARRAPLRRRRRGTRAGQRHSLRAGGLGLDPRRVPVPTRQPRDQGRMCLDQRPHPDHQRDAARRLQVLGDRQGHVPVLARGVHEHQARDVRRHGSGPQGLAPHRLHRQYRQPG